jgi:hypothetical protein
MGKIKASRRTARMAKEKICKVLLSDIAILLSQLSMFQGFAHLGVQIKGIRW